MITRIGEMNMANLQNPGERSSIYELTGMNRDFMIPDWAIEGVKEGRTQIDITITPDTKNIVISPWRPYEMKCPYGKE